MSEVITASIGSLFALLVVKPDVNTLLALPIVALAEFFLARIKNPPRFLFPGVIIITVIFLSGFLSKEIYPETSVWFFAVTLILALSYPYFTGTSGVLKMGVLVGILFLAMLIFVTFGSVKKLSPIAVDVNVSEVLKDALVILVLSPEILILKKGKKSFIGVSVGCMLWGFLLTVAVLGNFQTEFPFYTVSTLAKISVFSRLDAVHSAVWVLSGYTKCAYLLKGVKNEKV